MSNYKRNENNKKSEVSGIYKIKKYDKWENLYRTNI